MKRIKENVAVRVICMLLPFAVLAGWAAGPAVWRNWASHAGPVMTEDLRPVVRLRNQLASVVYADEVEAGPVARRVDRVDVYVVREPGAVFPNLDLYVYADDEGKPGELLHAAAERACDSILPFATSQHGWLIERLSYRPSADLRLVDRSHVVVRLMTPDASWIVFTPEDVGACASHRATVRVDGRVLFSDWTPHPGAPMFSVHFEED